MPLLALLACVGPSGQPSLHHAPPASDEERFCAWFGDARGGVLYFGEAAFWAEMRRADHPEGDRERLGPVRLGRFDLVERHLLDPVPIAAQEESGTWDVLAHPDGRVYFTTFFGPAGFVDPASGRVERFGAETVGLNELSLGPEGHLLATRYGEAGAVTVLSPGGEIVAEHKLAAPEGYTVAAKSVAWDPARNEIWVNTDLFPRAEGRIRHDARVLDAEGRELLRFDEPELQFVTFRADGAGYLALLEGSMLSLAVLPLGRDGPLADARYRVLDEGFPVGFDFVQDLKPTPDGGVVATRWSGRFHRLRDGELRSYALPRPEPGGLYYTGVVEAGHLCATFCGEPAVVCRRAE